MAVAKKLEEYFKNASINVVMTRSTPLGLYGAFTPGFKRRDLKKRMEIANGCNASIFISIHMNKFKDENRRGAMMYYKSESESSQQLALELQTQLDLVDYDNRSSVPKIGDFYVLNNSEMTAVLCECGFMSNAEDEKLLTSESYQTTLAYSIFTGTMSYIFNSDMIKVA